MFLLCSDFTWIRRDTLGGEILADWYIGPLQQKRWEEGFFLAWLSITLMVIREIFEGIIFGS
jgi:hypothetical protein